MEVEFADDKLDRLETDANYAAKLSPALVKAKGLLQDRRNALREVREISAFDEAQRSVQAHRRIAQQGQKSAASC